MIRCNKFNLVKATLLGRSGGWIEGCCNVSIQVAALELGDGEIPVFQTISIIAGIKPLAVFLYVPVSEGTVFFDPRADLLIVAFRNTVG